MRSVFSGAAETISQAVESVVAMTAAPPPPRWITVIEAGRVQQLATGGRHQMTALGGGKEKQAAVGAASGSSPSFRKEAGL